MLSRSSNITAKEESGKRRSWQLQMSWSPRITLLLQTLRRRTVHCIGSSGIGWCWTKVSDEKPTDGAPLTQTAHFIRRIATSFYRTCAALEANSRWCLTGTPIQNRLEDIGALFAFLKADPFHSLKVFRKHISTPFENHDTVVIERLVLLYDSLVLRRTKDIIKLPGQENHTRELDLSPDEMEQYNRTTNILNRRIRQFPGTDEPEDKFGLFQVQLQLRILCNHGTWQKLFSWKKRDLLEEVEAVVGEAGLNAEATCTGCKQPRPILGSNKIYNRFVEGCSHMLCAECLEDCGGEDITHCPLCKRFEKTSRGNAQTADIGDGESDEDMSTADDEDVPSRSGKKDDTYFNFDGHSTKMEALVQDVKVDLLTTKRFRITRFFSWLTIRNRANLSCSPCLQYHLLLLDTNSRPCWNLPSSQPNSLSPHRR